jgi:ATP-dependent protease ClpP protease subunit
VPDQPHPGAPDFRQRFGLLVASDRQPIRAAAPAPREADDGKVAVLRLYDPIDSYGEFWGVSAKEFAGVLDELDDDVEEIRLLINSPGGEVTEGIAIINALRAHPARVVGVVEGVAASIASTIAVSCDELVMARNSEIFIHEAWGLCVGNAADMIKLAETLDHLSDNMASLYAAKTGGTTEEWRAVMVEEKWFGAEQAVEAGLADSVDEGTTPDDAAKAKARFDLSIFKNAAGPRAGVAPVSATPPSPQPPMGRKGGSMPELTPEHLDLLGLTEDASAEDIQAKLTELAATKDPPDPAAALPDGVVAIDAAQLEELRANAQAGVDARAEQLKAHRAQVVRAAIEDGRIAPARSEHWLAQLEADPGAEQVLASLAAGTIPVSPKGTEGGDLDTFDAEYAALYGQEVKA